MRHNPDFEGGSGLLQSKRGSSKLSENCHPHHITCKLNISHPITTSGLVPKLLNFTC